MVVVEFREVDTNICRGTLRPFELFIKVPLVSLTQDIVKVFLFVDSQGRKYIGVLRFSLLV